jgi:hypothetical protein
MTYSFTLSKAQHWRATRVVQSRTLAHKLAWAFFGGVPLLIVAVLAFNGADVWAFVESHPLGVLGGPLLMVAGFPLIQYWTVWMHHRNHPTLRGVQVYALEPSRLGMKGPLHNTDLSWDAVVRVVETREFVLFYISKSTAYFLPKAAIPATELPTFRAELTRWLPGRVAFANDRT